MIKPSKQRQNWSLDLCDTDFYIKPAHLIMAGFFYIQFPRTTTSYINNVKTPARNACMAGGQDFASLTN